MSKSSYYRAVIEAVFHIYQPNIIQELSDVEFQNKVTFCETMLVKIDHDTRLINKILWSEESQFMLDNIVNGHNCCFWTSSNTHEQILVHKFKIRWGCLKPESVLTQAIFNRIIYGSDQASVC